MRLINLKEIVAVNLRIIYKPIFFINLEQNIGVYSFYSECGNGNNKKFKEEESNEILKMLGLNDNIDY